MLYSAKSMKISALLSEDISFAEYALLRLIAEMETETGNADVWVSDLVRRVDVTPQAVSKYTHLAARKGYIECFENASDRRAAGVRITGRGKSVLQKSHEELVDFRNRVFREFSDEELAEMNRLMNKLHAAVHKSYLQYKKK